MTRAGPLKRALQLAVMLALRYTPVPWSLKRRAIWLSQPNRDEILTITPDGTITRIVDLSAGYPAADIGSDLVDTLVIHLPELCLSVDLPVGHEFSLPVPPTEVYGRMRAAGFRACPLG